MNQVEENAEEWHEDVGACVGAASPSPAHPTLAQDPARPQTPHGPCLPAIRVRDAAPCPKASTLFVAKQSPRRPGCNTPRSTKPAACDTAPVCTRTDETHARRQTLPLRRWSTPHSAGSWPPFHGRALHRDRGRPTSASPGASARPKCSPSPSSLRVVTYPTRTLP